MTRVQFSMELGMASHQASVTLSPTFHGTLHLQRGSTLPAPVRVVVAARDYARSVKY